MSGYELPNEVVLRFDEVRVVYLALAEAEELALDGSELRIRLDECLRLLARKVLPDLGDLF